MDDGLKKKKKKKNLFYFVSTIYENDIVTNIFYGEYNFLSNAMNQCDA